MNGWRDRALCTQTDPELFFDDAPDSVERAKEICSECPVRDSHCMPHILGNDSGFGVQAGLTADERRQLPGWHRAEPVSVFAPLTDEELARRWNAEDARRTRRAQAEARRRDTDRIPFDQLTHPLDRKARS